jgi:hypothetical protein
VLDWLVDEWNFLGISGQIWMPAIGAALLIYVVILTIVRHRGSRTH